MSPDEFWRSTPRIVSLVIEGYLRRRAWGAWHAGYGTTGAVKDPEYHHLTGRPVKKPPMSPEQMLQNLRRHAIANNARFQRNPKEIPDGE